MPHSGKTHQVVWKNTIILFGNKFKLYSICNTNSINVNNTLSTNKTKTLNIIFFISINNDFKFKGLVLFNRLNFFSFFKYYCSSFFFVVVKLYFQTCKISCLRFFVRVRLIMYAIFLSLNNNIFPFKNKKFFKKSELIFCFQMFDFIKFIYVIYLCQNNY